MTTNATEREGETKTGWQLKAPPPKTIVRCARHADVDATFRCDRCRAQHCNFCVKQGEERGVKFVLCSCGGRCEAIVHDVLIGAGEFRDSVLGAFTYSLHGEARLQLLLGMVTFGATSWLFGGSMANSMLLVNPMNPLAPLGVAGVLTGAGALLAIAGYLFAYMELVITTTAKGRDDAPGFPDFLTVWESMFKPLGRLALLVALSFGPGALLLFVLPGIAKLLGGVLLLAGLAWFPMALLALAVIDSSDGLDPRRILASIRVVPAPYALAASLFVATFGLMIGGSFFLLDLPLVGGLLRGALVFYFATSAARVLGLTYRHYKKEFGWL